MAPFGPVASATSLAGTLTLGAVVSFTDTVKLPDAVLPAASVASQMTVVAPRPNVDPGAGVHSVKTEPSTRSSAEALNVAVAPAAEVSLTVTVNELSPVFPALSAAVQVTVVVPIGKISPGVLPHVTPTGPSTSSSAVAASQVAAAPVGPVASTVRFAGTVTTGLVTSWTSTVNVAVPLLPALSVAEHVTVVVPSANFVPEAGRQLAAIVPSTRSVAV